MKKFEPFKNMLFDNLQVSLKLCFEIDFKHLFRTFETVYPENIFDINKMLKKYNINDY